MGEIINLIYGGIDGTGEWNDASYERTFENSHVNTLYKNWSEGPKHYRRGPVTLDNKIDTNTRLQAHRVYDFVTEHWKNAGKKAVFLAGYSRGGAAVIEVASWLKSDGIPVECLILFDPVDRTGQVGLPWRDTPIASTVNYVIYAQRNRASESRESFGNCGTTFEDTAKTKLSHAWFRGTHGGLGGTPWSEPKEGYIDEGIPDGLTKVTVAEDIEAARQVKNWVFPTVNYAIYSCKQRFEQESQTTPNAGFHLPTNHSASPHLGGKKRIHVVKSGDWLSKIAQTYYGDINKWKAIYEVPENKATIGADPNLIKPGQKLVIP